MRSILKFLLYAIITMLVPTFFMGIAYYFGMSEIGILIMQMFVILTFVLVFTTIMKQERKKQAEAVRFVETTRDVQKLREFRDSRRDYKAKALATSKILSLTYSDKEAANLKKYASSKEDMDHYYSSIIDNSKGDDRDMAKVKRDNFNKRYEKKRRVYPSFEENLKTAIKWMIFFFVAAFLYNILPKFVKSEAAFVGLYVFGMIILAAIMINTIIWIVRSLTSFWVRDYI